jgi:nicotinate-nucleotide pyrophosphorylase (carboxylating)
MILIKDNHVAVVGSVSRAVSVAKERSSLSKKIEVEVARVADVLEAVDAGADIVMLDNFSPSQIKEAVGLLRKKKKYGRVLLEASGGISSENVLKFASTGVDLVSLGEITHSVRALNLSLEIVKTKIRSKSAEEC